MKHHTYQSNKNKSSVCNFPRPVDICRYNAHLIRCVYVAADWANKTGLKLEDPYWQKHFESFMNIKGGFLISSSQYIDHKNTRKVRKSNGNFIQACFNLIKYVLGFEVTRDRFQFDCHADTSMSDNQKTVKISNLVFNNSNYFESTCLFLVAQHNKQQNKNIFITHENKNDIVEGFTCQINFFLFTDQEKFCALEKDVAQQFMDIGATNFNEQPENGEACADTKTNQKKTVRKNTKKKTKNTIFAAKTYYDVN